MHYLICSSLLLSLWLGAHVKVNLHELKFECFPCAAVLKGQTTQRNAGHEAGEGPRPNPEFASCALYRPTAQSQLNISQRMLMLEGGDHKVRHKVSRDGGIDVIKRPPPTYLSMVGSFRISVPIIKRDLRKGKAF